MRKSAGANPRRPSRDDADAFLGPFLVDVELALRVRVDDRPEYRPGFKFNDWEMRGVPLRLEIGPKDIEKSQVMVARRDPDVQSVADLTRAFGFVYTAENIRRVRRHLRVSHAHCQRHDAEDEGEAGHHDRAEAQSGRFERGRLFLSEVRNELKRVTWPSQKEVYATTVVVILTSAFFGIYLFTSRLLPHAEPEVAGAQVSALSAGVHAKDVILAIIAKISAAGGTSHVIEYAPANANRLILITCPIQQKSRKRVGALERLRVVCTLQGAMKALSPARARRAGSDSGRRHPLGSGSTACHPGRTPARRWI